MIKKKIGKKLHPIYSSLAMFYNHRIYKDVLWENINFFQFFLLYLYIAY